MYSRQASFQGEEKTKPWKETSKLLWLAQR